VRALRALAALPPAGPGRKSRLERALEGAEFLTAEDEARLEVVLDRTTGIDTQIARPSEVFEQLLAPYGGTALAARVHARLWAARRPGGHRRVG
jgi:hypothetical protein